MALFLDANVWLPLAWERHPSAEATHRWLASQEQKMVLCRVTQLALLRHLTNPVIMGDDVLTNDQAAPAVEALAASDGVIWNDEPSRLNKLFPRLGMRGIHAPKLWTDAYLVGFAMAADHDLVTYDKGFGKFQGAGLRIILLEA